MSHPYLRYLRSRFLSALALSHSSIPLHNFYLDPFCLATAVRAVWKCGRPAALPCCPISPLAYTKRWWAARGPRGSFGHCGGWRRIAVTSQLQPPLLVQDGIACINQQLLAGDSVPVNSHIQDLDGDG